MTISKTYPVGRSGKRLQAGIQGQRKESGWATVGRWALAFAVALLVSVQADARAFKADQVVEGRIVGVIDGDTVDLLTDDLVQQRIRLRGIDAPEKVQAFGNRSKQALSALVFGRRVTVAYSKVDRYDRWVGRITVGAGDSAVDVSRAMIAQGMAWHYAFTSGSSLLMNGWGMRRLSRPLGWSGVACGCTRRRCRPGTSGACVSVPAPIRSSGSHVRFV